MEPQVVAGGSPARGLALTRQAACGACHVIPGLEWPKGVVGPPLTGFADRNLIAGRFPNQPDFLAAWVRNAPAMDPQTGMPASGLSQQEARDVAAYLYTLRAD